MPSIKISFFGNSDSKWVAYVIHQTLFFWKSGIKMCCLCHPSKFLLLENQHHNMWLTSPIKQFFLEIWHQMCCLGHPSKFPFLEIHYQNMSLMSSIKHSFLEIQHQNMLLMSSITILLFDNLNTKWMSHAIHQNFLF